jgi:hypothetical protein
MSNGIRRPPSGAVNTRRVMAQVLAKSWPESWLEHDARSVIRNKQGAGAFVSAIRGIDYQNCGRVNAARVCACEIQKYFFVL